ncbi:acyltransferase family protein [Pedobacter sandarakinus]|uniref:acyltransferase family protein n=1 Tax=Pedobacter sandarakinus TaxID=353156 RepID=UPI002245F094|nr:acyltransferase [Pedobacter sandarakinus]MCX2575913.1 acyltransferase [Pedobacter sandarakinus]
MKPAALSILIGRTLVKPTPPVLNHLSQSHLNSVDYIRTIASLAVTIFHLGGKTLPVLNYGWLGVQMFFVLSGFIICWSFPKNYQLYNFFPFFAKRFTRINPPYLASILLFVLIDFLLYHHHTNWVNALGHFFYVDKFFNQPALNPVYWTLAIEFQFYLLIGLIFPLLNKKWGIWILLAFNFLCLIIPISTPSLLNFFPLFSLGILAYYILSKKIDGWMLLFMLSLLLIISFYRLQIPQTLIGLGAFLLILTPLKPNRIVAFLAKISFSLYLTHDIIGSNFVVEAGKLVTKTFPNKALIFLGGFAISILTAWIFYILIEKPFIQLSKKISYKRMVRSSAV